MKKTLVVQILLVVIGLGAMGAGLIIRKASIYLISTGVCSLLVALIVEILQTYAGKSATNDDASHYFTFDISLVNGRLLIGDAPDRSRLTILEPLPSVLRVKITASKNGVHCIELICNAPRGQVLPVAKTKVAVDTGALILVDAAYGSVADGAEQIRGNLRSVSRELARGGSGVIKLFDAESKCCGIVCAMAAGDSLYGIAVETKPTDELIIRIEEVN